MRLLFIGLKYIAFVGGLVLLTACGATLDVKEIAKNIDEIKTEPEESSYFIAHDKKFILGFYGDFAVYCNDNIYKLRSGEFVECKSEKEVDTIGYDLFNDNWLTMAVLDTAKGVPTNIKLIVKPKPAERKFYKLLYNNDVTELKQMSWIDLMKDGYKKVTTPIKSKTHTHKTLILNPYLKPTTKYFLGRDYALPEHMEYVSSNISNNKQNKIVVFGNSFAGSTGIWTKDKLLGSLKSDGEFGSYIEFTTNQNEVELFSYFRGGLGRIKVIPKENETTYVWFNASAGWDEFKLEFKQVSEEKFTGTKNSLKKLSLKKKLPGNFYAIETEGLRAIKELVNQPIDK